MRLLSIVTIIAALGTASACSTQEGARQPASPPSAGAIAITVDATGYQPSSLKAPAGQLTHLVFTRTTDEGCGQQLVFPELNIRKDLPLNQPVAVDITMPASGSVTFTCGMDMWRGSVVVQ